MKRNTHLKPILFFIFLFIFSIFTIKASAEQIDYFETSIVVNKDGTIDVQEKIQYNFGQNAVDRHGIIRDIPLSKKNQEGKSFLMKISDIKIPNYNNVKTIERDKASFKIGDKDILVKGLKEYLIQYKISGALTYFIDKDEVYWNSTGDQWSVPILQAQTNIFLPDDIDFTNVSAYCYTGAYGQDEKTCTIQKNENSIIAMTTDYLEPYEGLTIAVGFPKGYVEELFPEEDKISLLATIITIIVLIGAFTLFLLWYVIAPIKLIIKSIKNNNFHKLHEKIVAAWFEPPEYENGKKFSPAETSTIVSNTLSNKAITATIINLAQKGFLKIHVKGKKDVTFEKLPEPSGKEISQQERKIFDAIFAKDSSITIKKLSKDTKFYNAIVAFKKAIPARLYDKKMYEEGLEKSNNKQIGMIILAIMTMNIPYIVLRIALKNKLIRRTILGIEKYSEAVSLKNFLVSQDEQLDYQAEKQLFFEKLLPYATAFGVEDVWIKKFEDLKFDTSDWYDGDISNAMALNSLTNNINKTINSSTSYAAGTSSSSGFSSGSSGGGFSGGGGGGGGGSSW